MPRANKQAAETFLSHYSTLCDSVKAFLACEETQTPDVNGFGALFSLFIPAPLIVTMTCTFLLTRLHAGSGGGGVPQRPGSA